MYLILWQQWVDINMIQCVDINHVLVIIIIICTHVVCSQSQAKVAVLGASGGIGQPMSLLLKQSPLVSQLVLYDIQMTKGVAADISHVETPAVVSITSLCEVLVAVCVCVNVIVMCTGVWI